MQILLAEPGIAIYSKTIIQDLLNQPNDGDKFVRWISTAFFKPNEPYRCNGQSRSVISPSQTSYKAYRPFQMMVLAWCLFHFPQCNFQANEPYKHY